MSRGREAALLLVTVVACACSSGRVSASCASATEPTLSYCTLITRAAEYDGKLVRTDAIWISGFHSDSLMDEACIRVGDRPGLTMPAGPSEDSRTRRELYAILGKGQPARVEITGVFRIGPNGDAGPDGQPYRLDVACILRVSEAGTGSGSSQAPSNAPPVRRYGINTLR